MTDSPFKYWRLCAWGGPVFLASFIVFWGILGLNIPPLTPAATADQVANHYLTHANQFRLGFGVAMTFAIFYGVWTVAIMKVMERVEGENHVLSLVQLVGGGLTVVWPTVSCAIWLTGSFRPETSPAILQTLYDLGWLLIDMAYVSTSVQMVAMAVIFLADKREVPLFPKLMNWYTIWVAFIFLALIILPFVKSGPFAWNGWFNYWIAFFAWFIWITGQSYFTFRAIGRLEQESIGNIAPAKTPVLHRHAAPAQS